MMCQVSAKTVYRAIRRGALSASRLGEGGAYRVRPDDVEQWIESSPARDRAPQTSAGMQLDLAMPPASSRFARDGGDGRLTVRAGMGRGT